MTSETKIRSDSTPGRSVSSFVIAQLLIVGVAVAGVTYRYQRLEQGATLPPLLETPRMVAPEPFAEHIEVIGEDQLKRVLRKLRPKLNRDTSIAKADHNLRFWGAEATFSDPQYASGERMRLVLLDHNVFRDLYGAEEADAKPLLIDVPETGGIRVRDFDGRLSSSHDDHTMACLSEVGTPLSFPVVTAGQQSGYRPGTSRQATYRQIVEQSLRDFSLNQVEYEWSALTYALHVKDVNHWTTSEGQTVSFDLLADRIMRQEMPQGVCFGNHRLHTLTVLLRVDDAWEGPTPMLSTEKREQILDFLEQMTIKLVKHQHADGFWNSDWPTSKPASSVPTETTGDRLSDRIIATGHALEWWALVPKQDREKVLPPDPRVYRDAGQWLVRTIDELSDSDVQNYAAFLSHAGRALALWRGKFPHQVDLREPVSEQEPTDASADDAEQPQPATDDSDGDEQPQIATEESAQNS